MVQILELLGHPRYRRLSWLGTRLSCGRSRVRALVGPTLSYDICNRLDFLVFSDKDVKPLLLCHGLAGDVKDPSSLFEKSRRLSPVIVVWPEGDCSNWLTLL